jgi:hypothetical protein
MDTALAPPETARITQRSIKPPAAERRAWIRYPGKLAPLPISDGEFKRGWWAELSDVSKHGVRVLMSSQVLAGTMLLIEVPQGAGQAPEPVLMRVIHVAQQSVGAWLIGCEFVRILTEVELQALLQSPEIASQ